MNNTSSMAQVNELIRAAIRRELDAGKTEDAIGVACGMSQSNVHKYLKGDPSPTLDVLKRFSHGLRIPIETLLAAEGIPLDSNASPFPSLPPHLQRLLDLVQHLDPDELTTLERCAEAFHADEPDVRQHLIGQLKLVERLVRRGAPPESPPARKKKANSPF